ncbi:hypothetical protein [Aquabacter cavernae]|uniref:hypothetical protein n=1 Tax=Aquabacter cavernae TaxID=2496029 RepID=UPI000F8F0FC0|nr:hypothetical protein [Aquabacter cavernae]
MTFTINVPVFPMRKEIQARRDKTLGSAGGSLPPRRRSRDAQGYVELELLPLEQLDRVKSTRARSRNG